MNPASGRGGWTASVGSGLELKLAAGLPLAPLRELLRATWYAQDAGRSLWDFAVGLERLVALGLSECDLRWLWCKGFLQHAVETTRKDGATRTFQKGSSLQLVARSSFVLTPEGMRLIEQLLNRSTSHCPEEDVGNDWQPTAMRTPCWDQQLRELRLDTILIKRFLVPAENQELVLSAFQEEDWPARIDDPLPPVPQIDAKRRLHSAIQCLNRNQRAQLVHFHGDGNGRGVRWELRHSLNGKA